MASQQAVVDAIILAASGAGDVSARKMFGEYALYCDGKVVALICDDQLFVKPTDAGRHLAGAVEDVPPYTGAKPSLLIPPDRWQDGAWLSELIRATTDALPLPKPKKTKKR
ncbi:competence protein TfoX [Sphingomonas sp. Leaf339]|uniref:TfoX/Sxy family protein n=1 Tax=Sphingomonas sp. Leaf339 TaxID=1736343 RepID=UPI0006FC0F54|nr:TfoX/Sxy family protein [Sphingomonas sp. Leaf339]KQU55894.1 competence protein TfoX [Sphingomonas sp. Leaf339]